MYYCEDCKLYSKTADCPCGCEAHPAPDDNWQPDVMRGEGVAEGPTPAKPFDLMKDKPVLDAPTLNWVWDSLWRLNACNRGENADRRAKKRAFEYVMGWLEEEVRTAQTEGR